MKSIKLLPIISIFFFTFLSSQFAFGQRGGITISGKITDHQTGGNIAGALVILHDANNGVSANDSGNYRLAGIRPGRYLLEVKSLGYNSAIVSIRLQRDTVINLALAQAIVEDQNVVVTSTAAAISSRRNPQPVTLVKQSQLLSNISSNVMDAVSHIVPGLSVLTTGPAIAKPFIRGLGYNRVLTINDGVRQEGQQWGDEHGIEIDDYSVQKVEVLKGPASLMYGSDALAGVINISSQLPAPEGTLQGNFTSEYQSNSALRGIYGNIGGTKNGFSFNAYGSYKGAEDYKNKYDGKVFNSRFYNKDFGGLLGYAGNWGHSRLLVSNFNQHIGMVDGTRDETSGKFLKDTPDGEVVAAGSDYDGTKPLVPYQHIRHFKLTSDNEFQLGSGTLDAIIGWQHNQRQEFGDPARVNIPDAYFDLKTLTYALQYHLPYMGSWKTVIGANGMRQTNTNKASEVLIPDYSLFDIGGFAITQYIHDKWTVSGGLRIDNRHVSGKAMADEDDPTELRFDAFTRDFSNVSGSAGVSYEATSVTTLKVNLSRGYRAPNLAELASNGAHEGTNRYEIGNNNLLSEKSLQIDGGVDINTQHVSVTASLFYNHINDFLFYEKVSSAAGGDSIRTDEEGNPLYVYRFSQHDANLYGGELMIDLHPHPLDWLHFENSIAYTRAKFTKAIDGTQNLPDIPAAHYVSTIRGNFLPSGKRMRNFFVSLESDYTFRQNDAFTGFNTETPTGGYWLVNASLGSDIMHKGNKIFGIYLSCNNLGDVAYQSHLSRLKYLDVNNVTGRQGVFAMGRNFSIKINVPLSWHWR